MHSGHNEPREEAGENGDGKRTGNAVEPHNRLRQIHADKRAKGSKYAKSQGNHYQQRKEGLCNGTNGIRGNTGKKLLNRGHDRSGQNRRHDTAGVRRRIDGKAHNIKRRALGNRSDKRGVYQHGTDHHTQAHVRTEFTGARCADKHRQEIEAGVTDKRKDRMRGIAGGEKTELLGQKKDNLDKPGTDEHGNERGDATRYSIENHVDGELLLGGVAHILRHGILLLQAGLLRDEVVRVAHGLADDHLVLVANPLAAQCTGKGLDGLLVH